MKSRTVFALAMAAVLGGSSALAQVSPLAEDTKQSKEKKQDTSVKAAVKEAPPAPAGGLVVFVDPVTGKIRQPSAAEIGKLVSPPGAVKPLAPKALVTKSLAGGGELMVLDSSFESYTVVTRQPDGRLAMECVTGEDAARDAVTNGGKSAKKPETKEAPDVR